MTFETKMTSESVTANVGDSYVASEDVGWRYPAAGDPKPPGGAKLLMLTKGGMCIVGQWVADGFFIAWSPMPKRDKAKEAKVV